MWARDMELALAFWLAVSPFVLGHPDGQLSLWVNDFTCATLVGVLALLAYHRGLRRIHLLELVVAAWLVGFGWVSARDGATPASQNQVLVGLLLAMFAIVPSEASRPPRSWRTDRDPV